MNDKKPLVEEVDLNILGVHLILNVIKEGSSFIKLLDKEKKKK